MTIAINLLQDFEAVGSVDTFASFSRSLSLKKN